MKQFNHRTIFFLLILLLPTQLAFHFWPSWASVFGIRVDYLAPTVYLTDLLVAGILLSWWRETKNFKFHPPTWRIKFPITPLVYLFVTSLFVAQNQGVALYKLVKLVEFILLGFYLFKNYTFHSLRSTLYVPLSIAVTYSCLIAWLQFLLGHTLGGPLWFLGERTFDTNTPGIALVTISGQDYLRPYATFPHPNVLAGFLLVALLLMNRQLDEWRPDKKKIKRLFYLSIYLFSILTLIITFSHSAWAAGLFALFVYCVPKFRQLVGKYFAHITLFAILLSLLFPFLSRGINTNNLPQEISRRIDLGQAAIGMLADNPLFGVGLGNFIVRLPEYGGAPSVSWFLQPVHNVFLLVLAETGLIGFGFVIWFLLSAFKKLFNIHYSLFTALLVILITGMADHYWFTLQQSQLMLAIVLGAGFSVTIKR